MPLFNYTARDASGTAVTGAVSADSVILAARLLRSQGKQPTSLKPAQGEAAGSAPSTAGLSLPRKDLIGLATQLSVMIDTGVLLSEALQCIADNAHKPATKAVVTDLINQVQAGNELSSAMARHPKAFPLIFTSLIHASEKNGMLAKLLNRAVGYLKDEAEILRKVKGALTYPAIMFAFAMGSTIFLLTFVMPRFTSLYASKGAALPTPTRLLMGVSNGLMDNWVWLAALTLAAVAALFTALRTEQGQTIKDKVLLRAPLLGGLYRKVNLARSLRMLGTLASSGVPLAECVKVARDLCSSPSYRALWSDCLEQINAGRPVSAPLMGSPLVPKPVVQMIAAAERGGKLASVAESVAQHSEEELKESITEMTRYIEPAMIVIMGSVIGTVALALLLPIFTISKVVAH
jgi:type IV pilus assembly protein PilC